jgi:hypothetical protein
VVFAKTNVEMECLVFKSRVFIGSIATASILGSGALAAAAGPALAVTPSNHHGAVAKVIGTVASPLGGANGAAHAISGTTRTVTGAAPVTGLLGGLAGLPILGGLFSALQNAASGSALGAVGGAVHSVTGALPGLGSLGSSGGSLNSALGSATGALGSLTSATNSLPVLGSVTGALSSLTGSLPVLGSLGG